jgi:hypothetical protein
MNPLPHLQFKGLLAMVRHCAQFATSLVAIFLCYLVAAHLFDVGQIAFGIVFVGIPLVICHYWLMRKL